MFPHPFCHCQQPYYRQKASISMVETWEDVIGKIMFGQFVRVTKLVVFELEE